METSDTRKEHTCYLCARTGLVDCVLAGYDEFGPLWICPECRGKIEDSEKKNELNDE